MQPSEGKRRLFVGQGIPALFLACLALLNGTTASSYVVALPSVTLQSLLEASAISSLTVPATAKEEDLRPIFAPYGEITEIFLLRKDAGEHRGCAFVTYRDAESADAAIAATHNTHTLHGVCSFEVFAPCTIL